MSRWPWTVAERAHRDALIVRAYAKGKTLAQIGRDVGLSESGVSRVLCRCDARPTRTDRVLRRKRRARRLPGRRPFWPDCPAHLAREFRTLRSIIGAEAARAQLIALDARERAESQQPTGGAA